MTGRDAVREQLAAALAGLLMSEASVPEAEALLTASVVTPALLPTIDRIATERAAAELERLVDERTWTTEYDNEVVSARDLYEQVARLRGELEPVTYDFPPDEASDATALRASNGQGAT